MHESALGRDIVRAALDAVAIERGVQALTAHTIDALHVTLVESEAIHPDSLSLHIRMHARGTPAEGARLHLDVRQARATCGACPTEYLHDHHVPVCPACGCTQTRACEPTFLRIDRVTWREVGAAAAASRPHLPRR